MMGVVAVVASVSLGEGLRDPDGSLGPGWMRMPLMVGAAFVVDVVPRGLWRARRRPRSFWSHAKSIIDEHWTRDRISLVVIGLVSFYITYVSYRNLKNFLPLIGGQLHDKLLHNIDKAIMFGHEPAIVLHQLLGETWAAQVLAAVYLLFLPISPLSLVVYLVWSRNISYGYWYATAQCLAWALGTVSYYLLPTLGPNFAYVWLYVDLKYTGVTALQDSLFNGRVDRIYEANSDSIQSVAGFASLHVGIILTLALVTHYTVRHAWIRWSMWVYFGLTVVSTLYFGWHYIADDIAGALIAIVSVWLGGLATGQKFEKHGRSSHPTTSTADVPVDDRDAQDDGGEGVLVGTGTR
ncbi:MAG: phosphatase PAP2 family protein [Nocardioidaceae bacterium]|nr:phosphatase PAP2 family protein [Nocardioidaceae bacterium]